jgi:FtsH-binding integral membrane protein
MATQDVEIGLVEASREVKDLPAEIRLGFIKKVYGLMLYMVVLSGCASAPFVAAPDKTLAWMDKHPYVPIACGVLFLGFYLFNLVMISTALCCRSPRLMNAYHRMFLTAPANLIFLTVVSVVFGVMVGFGLLAYTMQSVVAVFGLTCGLIVALTAFAVYTKADFTGLGAYFLVALVGLLLTGILVGLTSYPGSVAHKIYAGLGATVFGFLVVYDTQLIFGTASSAERKLQYTVDAYAFAAFQLYLDYINLFLYLLQLLGQRR